MTRWTPIRIALTLAAACATGAGCDPAPADTDPGGAGATAAQGNVCCHWDGWNPVEVASFNCEAQGGEVLGDEACAGDWEPPADDAGGGGDDTLSGADAEPAGDDAGGAGGAAAGSCCRYSDGSVYYVSHDFCVASGGSWESGEGCVETDEGGTTEVDDGEVPAREEDTSPAGEEGWVCCTFPSGVTIWIPIELCDLQGGSYIEKATCDAAAASG